MKGYIVTHDDEALIAGHGDTASEDATVWAQQKLRSADAGADCFTVIKAHRTGQNQRRIPWHRMSLSTISINHR